MSRDVLVKTVDCLDEFLKKSKNNQETNIVLHGGEPLIIGPNNLSFFLSKLSKLRDKHGVSLSIQTNGTLVNKKFIDIFKQHQITIGISLDGYPEIQNKTKSINGQDSYSLILRGLNYVLNSISPEYFKGVLAVIDLNGDPLKIYQHFLDLGINRMEFLFPLRNHKYCFDYNSKNLDYFNWLKQIFDSFIKDDDDRIDIRIFTSIIDLLIGAQMPMCSIRHSAIDMLVIETNGSIELVDDLRICGEDFTNLGLNVFLNSIDDFFNTKRVYNLYLAEKELPKNCISCDYLNICGSGGHAFRFGKDETYNHPSIYCEDTKALISHISNSIFEENS